MQGLEAAFFSASMINIVSKASASLITNLGVSGHLRNFNFVDNPKNTHRLIHDVVATL